MHESGIDMGEFDETQSYDQGNQYERESTQRINRAMLDCGDRFSLEVTNVVGPGAIRASTHDEMLRTIRDLDARHADWGFKDPRTCLTYAVWRPALEPHRVIAIYRHPVEVWNHYTRGRTLGQRLRTPIRGWAALRAWFVYNAQILACRTELEDRCLLFDYGRYMHEDGATEALAKFLDRELVDVRQPELYRAGHEPTRLYAIVSRLQALLRGRDIEKLHRSLEAVSL